MGAIKNRKIWWIILVIGMILCGCAQDRPNPSLPSEPKEPEQAGQNPVQEEQEEIKMVDAALFEITRMELIYLGEEKGYRVLLSPYEENLLYRVEDEANVLCELPLFSQFSLATDLSDGSVFLASCQTPKGRVPVVQANTFEEAALIYPQALLAYFRNSFFWQQYSLEDYTIQSVKVVKNKKNYGTVSFVCDISPSYSPFDETLGYFWSQGGKDQRVEKKEVSIDLYGFDGNFSCSPVYPIFLEETGEIPHKEPPLYMPVLYEDSWQAMLEGKETEDVIYEEFPYSYVIGTRLQQGEADSPGAFFSTIYQIDTKNGNQRKVLADDLPEGLIDMTPFAQKGDWLFCTSSYAIPYSESQAGQVVSLHVKTGEYEILLPRQSAIMGAKGDWFYFAVMGIENSGQDGIYRLDVKGETVQKLSPLPGEKYNTAYFGSFINYMDGADIYFSWPNEADLLQEYAFFLLDSKLGRLAQLK